jgi:hypothetical protein
VVLDKFVLVLSEPPAPKTAAQHHQTASELRLEECRNHVRKCGMVARGRGEEERSTRQRLSGKMSPSLGNHNTNG